MTYTCDLEPGSDYIIIYNLDDLGNATEIITVDQGTGSVTTSLSTGKAKIVFYSDAYNTWDCGYNGFTLQFAPLNSLSAAQVLNYQGNTILSGNVGIGKLTPAATLDIAGTIRGGGASGSLNILTDNGTLEIGPQDGTYSRFNTSKSYYLFDKTIFSSTGKYGALDQDLCFFTTWSQRMVINKTTGNVGIGTTSPKYKLDVNGAIRATEIKVVSPDSFPDYVFDKAHYLPKLNEIRQYIAVNGHLPGIQSAADAKLNGIDLVDMQMKLLKKMEEMTLYILEQQETIERLEEKLDAVKTK